MVAVLSAKYSERPLIGKVNSVTGETITIDWFIGTYSGDWKLWKGRHGQYSDDIHVKDVLYRNIVFSKSMRLKASTVLDLKKIYK